MVVRLASVQVEVYFYGDHYWDGMAVFLAGFELPVLYRFDSFFIEAHAQCAQNVDLGGAACGVDHYAQHTGALVFGLAGFFGEFGVSLIDYARRGYSAADAEGAAAHAGLVAGANTAAVARANTAARA